MFEMPLQAMPFWERQLLRRLARCRARRYPGDGVLCLGRAACPRHAARQPVYPARALAGVARDRRADRQWRGEERDLRADFLRLFGDESSQLPPVRAVLVAATPTIRKGAAWPLKDRC